MALRWNRLAVVGTSLILVAASPSARLRGAELPVSGGALIGTVSDGAGISQMGATVFLYNRFEKLVAKALTNERGQFGFDNLLADTYSIRVSLTSFVPAVRQGILIQPGMRSFLAIHLASVLSSVELVYSTAAPPRLLSDDWRWVLRSSMSTRPVLRYLPNAKTDSAVFSNTRGLVRVSAGDGANALQGNQPDLGTAFAVATSLYGVNNLQVSGNVGYVSRAGLPTASFRTRFSRAEIENGLAGGLASPEVQLTFRQAFLPTRSGALLNSAGGAGTPGFGTMSALVIDRAKVSDFVDILYGAQLESVSFVNRINILSPFARIDIHATRKDSVRIAWSSGVAPDELYLTMGDADLQQGLATLSAFPRVSMRDGHAHVQRMEQVEAAYTREIDSKTRASLVAYYENVANAALTASGDTSSFATSEMLPDVFTNSSIFNIGSYQGRGLMASIERQLGSDWTVQAAFGNSGTLQPTGIEISDGDAEALRRALRRTQRSWISMRAVGTLPGSGTRVAASYQLTDYRTALPAHRYLTQRTTSDLGMNIMLRQPLPHFGLWSGRIEAIAELRNLLQQGYLPINTTGGRRVLLVPSPRTVRGGLAFIF